MTNAQEWLDREYPKWWRKMARELRLKEKKHSLEFLEGDLDLSDFINLRKLNCSENKLTSLNLSNCSRLIRLDCFNNSLTNLTLPNNSTNLKELNLAMNKFTGSLDFLSNMNQLKYLDISDTDLNEVDIDKLPRSLKRVKYSTERNPDCKLTAIISQLEKYKWGFCQKCQQPNTSKGLCQPCLEKEWKKELEHLTGQELVEKFIKQQQLKLGKNYYRREKIKWIPYEKFTNIEYLAQGGFGKVYKAKRERKRVYENDFVALKILNNSQNLTIELLTEIANNKLVDDEERRHESNKSNVVTCYGISRDPITKNYVIVMEYMNYGDLRQYLQSKNSELTLEDKIHRLSYIACGLNKIHQQNLVHCDFHSGNILNNFDDKPMISSFQSCIADLGLCRPASEIDNGKVYGVLPYVAPEVLQGKSYTKKSDIYSFGIVAYEWLVNSYPYPKLDDMNLALKICRGYRPNIEELKIPQKLKKLIKRCWDNDPKKRPTAEELYEIIHGWYWQVKNRKNTSLFFQQYQALEEEYNTFSKNTPYQIHPTATTYSKMIDTNEISKKLMELSQSAEFPMTEFQKALEEIDKQDWITIHFSFTSELVSQWTNHNFTYHQTQDWINIGLQSSDHNFCVWLRDNKHFTPEQVLNESNLEQLNQGFLQEQQQSNIEILPKK